MLNNLETIKNTRTTVYEKSHKTISDFAAIASIRIKAVNIIVMDVIIAQSSCLEAHADAFQPERSYCFAG